MTGAAILGLAASLALAQGAAAPEPADWEQLVLEASQTVQKAVAKTSEEKAARKTASAPAVMCRPSVGECFASCNHDGKIRCVPHDPACKDPREPVGTYCRSGAGNSKK